MNLGRPLCNGLASLAPCFLSSPHLCLLKSRACNGFYFPVVPPAATSPHHSTILSPGFKLVMGKKPGQDRRHPDDFGGKQVKQDTYKCKCDSPIFVAFIVHFPHAGTRLGV